MAAPIPDKFWTDGDFTLVSSDNCSFKVWSTTLKEVSSTFGDVEFVAIGELRIEFTDSVIETRENIDDFLSLASMRHAANVVLDVGYSLVLWRYDIEPLEPLIAFLDKYDCQGLKRRLLASVADVADVAERAGLSLTAFIIGALSDSVSMCKRALSREQK